MPDAVAKPLLEVEQRPFLLADATPEGGAVANTGKYRLDPFEVHLSGKLLRAQLRGTMPARFVRR